MKRKRIIVGGIIVLVFVVLFGGIFGWNMFVKAQIAKYMANYAPPAAQVTAEASKAINWRPYIENTGAMEALNGVNVTPQTSGLVTKILFRSGQMVKKDQPILLLDDREAKAQLANAIAAARLSEINYHRQWQLYQQKAVSKSALDTAAATLAEDNAKVEEYRTSLSYKTVRAPFAGKIGIRKVDVGQYLSSGDNIADLQTLDPIHVNFFVPEQEISKIYIGQPVTLTVSTYPGVTFSGKVSALDAAVSNNTKSIEVQATIPNHNAKAILLPGMFAIVRALMPEEKHVVVVPQEAITYTLYGTSVYVVTQSKDKKTGKPQTIAKQTYIKTGRQQGNWVAVTSGLKAGDQVVIDGQVKLQDNAPIKVVGKPTGRPTSQIMKEP